MTNKGTGSNRIPPIKRKKPPRHKRRRMLKIAGVWYYPDERKAKPTK